MELLNFNKLFRLIVDASLARDKNQMDHFVLTRFNVRPPDGSTARIHDFEWLAKRLELFENFCLPSVVHQTRVPTAWLIFLDCGTPSEIRLQFDGMVHPYPFIKPVYCSGLSAAFAAECIRSHASPDCRWVITTRLDNDDAIHVRLLENVFTSASIGTYEFINAPSGLVVCQDRFYSKSDRSSPFISASEPMGDCKTVWIDQHHRLGRYAPIKQLSIRYAWIQIIHGDNLANRVRGIRVPGYSIDKEGVPHALVTRMRKEPLGELFVDNSIGLVIRYGGSLIRWLRRHVKESLNKSG